MAIPPHSEASAAIGSPNLSPAISKQISTKGLYISVPLLSTAAPLMPPHCRTRLSSGLPSGVWTSQTTSDSPPSESSLLTYQSPSVPFPVPRPVSTLALPSEPYQANEPFCALAPVTIAMRGKIREMIFFIVMFFSSLVSGLFDLYLTRPKHNGTLMGKAKSRTLDVHIMPCSRAKRTISTEEEMPNLLKIFVL